jgi:hypothetical protein
VVAIEHTNFLTVISTRSAIRALKGASVVAPHALPRRSSFDAPNIAGPRNRLRWAWRSQSYLYSELHSPEVAARLEVAEGTQAGERTLATEPHGSVALCFVGRVGSGGLRCAFNPDGLRIVIASEGNTAPIWSLPPRPSALNAGEKQFI